MDDNDDYDFVPEAPSNITIPFQPTNVLNDAFSIILCGLAFFAIVALNIGAGVLNFWFIGFVSSLLGMDNRNGEAQALTVVNGVICGAVVFFTSLVGFDDRGFIGSLWHALVVEAIILAFLLLVELVVMGLYCCANADWSRKRPAAEVVEMKGPARPMYHETTTLVLPPRALWCHETGPISTRMSSAYPGLDRFCEITG